jgi:hypothetical protein
MTEGNDDIEISLTYTDGSQQTLKLKGKIVIVADELIPTVKREGAKMVGGDYRRFKLIIHQARDVGERHEMRPQTCSEMQL